MKSTHIFQIYYIFPHKYFPPHEHPLLSMFFNNMKIEEKFQVFKGKKNKIEEKTGKSFIMI